MKSVQNNDIALICTLTGLYELVWNESISNHATPIFILAGLYHNSGNFCSTLTVLHVSSI